MYILSFRSAVSDSYLIQNWAKISNEGEKFLQYFENTKQKTRVSCTITILHHTPYVKIKMMDIRI